MKKTSAKKKSETTKISPLVYSGDDLIHHISAFSEGIRSDVAGIAEQVGGLYTKIDEVDERLSQKIDDVKVVVDSHSIILNEHSKVLHEHSRMLHEHSALIGRLLIDMEEVKSGMREKIDRQEFTKLEKRMVALEAYVFSGKAKQKAK